MWTDVLHCIKFEYSPGNKPLYNCAILYLMALIMNGLEFSKDPKKDHINPWPECKFIALNKTMVKFWNKRAIELGYRKG